MSPKRVDARQKRQAIAAAALQVFSRKSYGDTRIQDIADEAGIGKGTIYEYFRDKAEILHEIFETEFRSILERENESAGARPLQLLLEHIRATCTAAVAQPDLNRLWFEVWSSGVIDAENPIHKKMRDLFEDLAELYRAFINRAQAQGEIHSGIDAGANARMIVSALDGIALHSILFKLSFEESRIRCESFIDMVRRSLLTGGDAGFEGT